MDSHGISFASLGFLVLDEIRFRNQEPLVDILGGSGSWATLGARLFCPPPQSRSVAWPIYIGNDFPAAVADRLDSWDISLAIERETDKPSLRGLLEYRDTTFGPKDFKYTTEVLAVEEDDLQRSPILASKVFHYLATGQVIQQRVSRILTLREKAGISRRPLIIWEPDPRQCSPENLDSCLAAAACVDVISPNHIELARLYGVPSDSAFDKTKIETFATKFLDNGIGLTGDGTIVVRSGEQGCYIKSRACSIWLPPFYEAKAEGDQASEVVDPTGAGNIFLGGFAIGFLKTKSVSHAACYGSVAASFALEQVGMPTNSSTRNIEFWNGASVLDRLQEYLSRPSVSTALLHTN